MFYIIFFFQALVLAVIAENSLPFTMAPVLVNMAKTLALDKHALAGLTMDRTTASYKLRFGLSKTIMNETIKNLNVSKFSLNIDEATSNNKKRVLTLLVCYFSNLEKRVVIEHLASISLISVTSETVFKEVDKIFLDHQIPYLNLMSILMDSCSVMRGSKSGFELRMRNEKAPHLLDIDGHMSPHS